MKTLEMNAKTIEKLTTSVAGVFNKQITPLLERVANLEARTSARETKSANLHVTSLEVEILRAQLDAVCKQLEDLQCAANLLMREREPAVKR